MNYAFLGRMIPTDFEEEVKKLSVNNMQDAANAFQWHLYDGLCENLNKGVSLINVLPIGSYPQYYKRPFVEKKSFCTKYEKNNINVGFFNLKLVRNYLLPRKIEKELLAWCKENKENRTVFVYTLFAPFLKAIKKTKKMFPDLKACAIVADLPDMSNLSSKKSAILKAYEKTQSQAAYKLMKNIDAYVLLTKHMAEYMGIEKPFCVVEGISTEFDGAEKKNDENENIKTILYSGTLHRKFGVLNLLEAFKLVDKENYRLVICGIGDSENEIRQAAERDIRIVFKGQLSRQEVLKLQSSATVLVNPRQNNEEFTKYSFPSKTMEYLSSGTPVIAYKLDGIPDEYDKYINFVTDNSPSALANAIVETCELSKNKRTLIGEKARAFVLEEKNYLVQTKKILDFIKEGA